MLEQKAVRSEEGRESGEGTSVLKKGSNNQSCNRKERATIGVWGIESPWQRQSQGRGCSRDCAGHGWNPMHELQKDGFMRRGSGARQRITLGMKGLCEDPAIYYRGEEGSLGGPRPTCSQDLQYVLEEWLSGLPIRLREWGWAVCFIFIFIYCYYSVCERCHATAYMWGQRVTMGSWFSPSTMDSRDSKSSIRLVGQIHLASKWRNILWPHDCRKVSWEFAERSEPGLVFPSLH